MLRLFLAVIFFGFKHTAFYFALNE